MTGDGSPVHPGYASGRFRLLVRRVGLPPVRLHDLRHGAASLAHEAGADLKTLQELLGHSSIVVTADTYTSVLPQVQRRCADATARLVLNAARRTRKTIKTRGRKNRPSGRPKSDAFTLIAPISAPKSQIRSPRRGKTPTETTAPTPHPHDTYSPCRTHDTKRPTCV